MDRIAGMKAELNRLLEERPALESERKRVFDVVDHAPHMIPAIRLEVRELYNKDLARVQADISGIRKQLVKMGGDSGA